jgi:membrane protein
MAFPDRGRHARLGGAVPRRTDRDTPQLRWVSPGAVVIALLWIVASTGFTLYVADFNRYNKPTDRWASSPSCSPGCIFHRWLVLLGAAINAQSEKQTRRDSTEGQSRPMGQRRACAADTLGASKV